MNKTFSLSGLGTAESKYVMPINKTINNEQSFEKNIEDGFSSDGIGNANTFIKNNSEDKISSMGLSGSIVDTDKMEYSLDSVKQKVLFGEINVTAPYSMDSITKSLLHGQHVGLKTEAEISKSSFSGDVSPLSGDVIFGQVEAKANYENYTVSGAAGVAAVKVELKLEPLNFFGYEPLEEWFGFDYDPFIGVDFSLGSIGVGASVGLETSIYAAYGVGIGVKAGMEEDK